jgi:hypothetical protein
MVAVEYCTEIFPRQRSQGFCLNLKRYVYFTLRQNIEICFSAHSGPFLEAQDAPSPHNHTNVDADEVQHTLISQDFPVLLSQSLRQR